MTQSYNDVSRKASCSQCSSSFNLIPPADEEYNLPREKPRDEDYLKRVYECELNHHLNTIYWQRRITTTTGPTQDYGTPSSSDY